MQLMEVLFPIIRNSMQFCHCLSSGYHDYLSFTQDMHLVVSSISWLCRIFITKRLMLNSFLDYLFTRKKGFILFKVIINHPTPDKLNLQMIQRRKSVIVLLLIFKNETNLK